MASSPMTEATGVWPAGAARFQVVNALGMFASSGSGGRSGRPVGRRLAGPVQVAVGRPGTWRGSAVAVIHISTAPLSTVMQASKLRLCSNPPLAYAQVVTLA